MLTQANEKSFAPTPAVPTTTPKVEVERKGRRVKRQVERKPAPTTEAPSVEMNGYVVHNPSEPAKRHLTWTLYALTGAKVEPGSVTKAHAVACINALKHAKLDFFGWKKDPRATAKAQNALTQAGLNVPAFVWPTMAKANVPARPQAKDSTGLKAMLGQAVNALTGAMRLI
jgi:hypothetical protein